VRSYLVIVKLRNQIRLVFVLAAWSYPLIRLLFPTHHGPPMSQGWRDRRGYPPITRKCSLVTGTHVTHHTWPGKVKEFSHIFTAYKPLTNYSYEFYSIAFGVNLNIFIWQSLLLYILLIFTYFSNETDNVLKSSARLTGKTNIKQQYTQRGNHRKLINNQRREIF
jgi:hypothetical protein